MKKDVGRVLVVVLFPVLLLRSLRPGGILLSDRVFSCKTSDALGWSIVLIFLDIYAKWVVLGLQLRLWVVYRAQMLFLLVEGFFGETCCRLLL